MSEQSESDESNNGNDVSDNGITAVQHDKDDTDGSFLERKLRSSRGLE